MSIARPVSPTRTLPAAPFFVVLAEGASKEVVVPTLLVKAGDDVGALITMLVVLLTRLLEDPPEKLGVAIDRVLLLLIAPVGTNDPFVGTATGPEANAVSK